MYRPDLVNFEPELLKCLLNQVKLLNVKLFNQRRLQSLTTLMPENKGLPHRTIHFIGIKSKHLRGIKRVDVVGWNPDRDKY